jgi:hypothetical protein
LVFFEVRHGGAAVCVSTVKAVTDSEGGRKIPDEGLSVLNRLRLV